MPKASTWRYSSSAVVKISTGRVIPTRWIGEQHIREDFGHIPSFVDWCRAIKPQPWMRLPKLEL